MREETWRYVVGLVLLALLIMELRRKKHDVPAARPVVTAVLSGLLALVFAAEAHQGIAKFDEIAVPKIEKTWDRIKQATDQGAVDKTETPKRRGADR